MNGPTPYEFEDIVKKEFSRFDALQIGYSRVRVYDFSTDGKKLNAYVRVGLYDLRGEKITYDENNLTGIQVWFYGLNNKRPHINIAKIEFERRFQRKRLGHETVSKISNIGSMFGYKHIELMSLPDAEKFWRKLGFEELGSSYYRLNLQNKNNKKWKE